VIGSIVVTGGARGIGLATADAVLDDGYQVVVVDRDAEALSAVANERHTDMLTTVSGDVTDTGVIEGAITMASQAAPLVGFVSNAGISRPGPSIGYPRADWDELVEVHMTAAFEGARAAARAMTGPGAIVCTASISGLQGFAGRAAYSAAKAGIVGLVRSLAVEWGPKGIRVNAVVPGYIATELVQENVRRGFVDEDHLRRRIPLGRLGTPKDVGRAIRFLLSPDAEYITGTTLLVDGGWMAFGLSESPDSA
jgi:NAD(P)-dependent dehydrogenase (short-subunit alcohol dehydrogenase family)